MTNNMNQDRDNKQAQKQPLDQNKTDKSKVQGGEKSRDASWSGGSDANKTDRR